MTSSDLKILIQEGEGATLEFKLPGKLPPKLPPKSPPKLDRFVPTSRVQDLFSILLISLRGEFSF